MARSDTLASKEARARSSKKTQKKIVAAGGWRLAVMLYPPAAAALRAEMARTKESAAAIINGLAEKLAEK